MTTSCYIYFLYIYKGLSSFYISKIQNVLQKYIFFSSTSPHERIFPFSLHISITHNNLALATERMNLCTEHDHPSGVFRVKSVNKRRLHNSVTPDKKPEQ